MRFPALHWNATRTEYACSDGASFRLANLVDSRIGYDRKSGVSLKIS